ncbi:hypothetical protein GOODEAATRI_017809 [Goodea atripinnis]|uniref:Myosin light chain kinase n=1 Tax=Goodea atripinnis TaxID=208336 RepID=A0ABV0NL45_9TELE
MILQFPEDMKILAGEKVEILCKFSGAPPITCTWLKFRKPEDSSDISIESSDSSSKLTISSGQQEHCGCYTIELRNSYGLRQAALNLTIVDKPDPPAKVPAASDLRRSSLTLSWYGPTYDGGSAVQTYHLEIWDSVGQQWKQLVSCNSTSYNVQVCSHLPPQSEKFRSRCLTGCLCFQNLLPERQYKFRVRAQNIYGIGEPSVESEAVTVGLVDDGGELFERIIDEDFELTEREVIKYMLQIIDGVNFIHKQGIVHLDLKPENIMCVNKTGSKIKLIDFGLARRLENAGTLKVLFGTPEFVAPEVINYEAISYPTDMWSIGVICYILLSGLSPFMGDNDNETLANVTSATWDFEDEAFDEISENAKDFITNLLKKDMKARLTCPQCFEHPWLKQDTNTMKTTKLSKERMKKYILRRKWQVSGDDDAKYTVKAVNSLGEATCTAELLVEVMAGEEEEEEEEEE